MMNFALKMVDIVLKMMNLGRWKTRLQNLLLLMGMGCGR